MAKGPQLGFLKGDETSGDTLHPTAAGETLNFWFQELQKCSCAQFTCRKVEPRVTAAREG